MTWFDFWPLLAGFVFGALIGYVIVKLNERQR